MSKLEFCEQCVLGKEKKVIFNIAIHYTQSLFDYVHFDLCGPARTITHGHGRFFLYIIDDFPKRVWVFILKTKGDTNSS